MKLYEKIENLSGETDNKDLEFILKAVAIEVEMNHVSRISSFAHAIADVQDEQVFNPNNIIAPRRNDN